MLMLDYLAHEHCVQSSDRDKFTLFIGGSLFLISTGSRVAVVGLLDSPTTERLRVRVVNPSHLGRRELDSLVINIELTLVSIIQGVALFFLTDNARGLFSTERGGALLYVAAGLCVIFIFWSRSVIHTLTLIRWPLEFGHNFFYIACALGEAVLFSRLDNPGGWFQLSAGYAGIVWLLFIYDMRLIRARIAEANNDSERLLYRRASSDQFLNICLLVPLLISLNLACVILVWRWPDFFVARTGHIWLIAAQLVAFVCYLFYTSRYFNAIAPLVLRTREAN